MLEGTCGDSTNWPVGRAGAQYQISWMGLLGSLPTSWLSVACEASTCRNTAFQPATRTFVCVLHWAWLWKLPAQSATATSKVCFMTPKIRCIRVRSDCFHGFLRKTSASITRQSRFFFQPRMDANGRECGKVHPLQQKA